MLRFKKAISPVIAVSLLLVVAVISVVGFSNWFTDFSSIVFSDVELQSSNSGSGGVVISDLIGETLYVVNNGDFNSNISKFLINGVECELGELDSGMNEIDISNCIETIPEGSVDLVLVTGTEVIEKEIYFEGEFVSTGYFGPSDVFVSVWDTRLNSSGSSNQSQINLPLSGLTSDYNFNISWGDGITETISTNVALHDYDVSGVYQIEIYGLIRGFRFANVGDRNKLLDIKQWGNLKVGNSGNYFHGCENFVGTFSDDLNLSGITRLDNMFFDAKKFNGDITRWNTSGVLKMNYMFTGASSFNQDIGSWDVSSVDDMIKMFSLAIVFNQDLDKWDVSSVINFYEMFRNANNFNGDISTWKFDGTNSLNRILFSALAFNNDIGLWDVSHITSFERTFANAISFNKSISLWNTSSALDMTLMFNSASKFNQNISGWDVDQVTDCNMIFGGVSSLQVSNQMNFTNCSIS